MKFEQKLLQSLYEPWRFYYIDYSSLKQILKPAKEGNFHEKEESLFIKNLEIELDKIESFYEIKFGEFERHSKYLIKTINGLNSKTNHKNFKEIKLELDELIQQVSELAKFTALNYTGFLKIVKKHDKVSKYNIKATFSNRLNRANFYNANYDNLLYNLSNLYDFLRNEGNKNEDLHGTKNRSKGAQNFVRKTTKYWVHQDNVTELKLFVLKHLPVLVFNQKEEFDSSDSAITSIYFDNESFDLYIGRLEKSEGAEAIRLRWYGRSSNEEIFVERKTHREDWTGEKSIKERFTLKEKRINAYLKGEYTIQDIIDKEKKTGNKTEQELQKLKTLSTEIQQHVTEKKLRPMIRSFYNRTAFQLPDDAKVRISLDTELSLIREDNIDGISRSGNNWRRTDIGTDWPFNQLKNEDICRFPYAILEVKLQTQYGAEPPNWVEKLINSHLVEPVPKFSKYIHGVSTLLEPYVKLFPFWLPQMNVDIRREPTDEWRMIMNETPDTNTKKDAASTSNAIESQNQLNSLISQVQESRERESSIHKTNSVINKKIKIPVVIEPKVFFANERTFLSWLHFSVVIATLSVGLLNFGDKVAQVSAMFFTIISLIIMGYSIFLFVWRAQRIRQALDTNYDDQYGPLLLVLFIMLAVVVSFYLKLQHWKGNLPSVFYTTNT